MLLSKLCNGAIGLSDRYRYVIVNIYKTRKLNQIGYTLLNEPFKTDAVRNE